MKSRSEDDLLTPQCVSTNTSSWSGDTPDIGLTFPRDSFSETPASSYGSEPTITVSKPASSAVLFPRASAASPATRSVREDRSHTGPTLLKIKHAFGDLHSIVEPQDDSGTNSDVGLPSETSHKSESDDHDVTFGQIEMTPLHIDSALFDSGLTRFVKTSPDGSLCLENENRAFLKNATGDCSQLIDALDIQSPVAFRLDTSSRVQSTPYATRSRTNANTSLPRESLLTDKTDSPQDQAEKPQNHPGANETRQ